MMNQPLQPPPSLRVRISMNAAPGGMELFTPGGSMQWGNCSFTLNAPDDTECDFWIVFANARPREAARIARRNTLFIAGEPPAKKIYPRKFYQQFHQIVDTHAGSQHPRLHLDALGLPWLVGLSWKAGRYTIGYDALQKIPLPAKMNKVSVVCSNTAKTPGQRQRLAFLAALKRQLGDELIHFGKGFTPIDDKMEAILPHRFHLVLENSQSPHYWTEKLTDAYLGWAVPLNVGCPNLGDYFAPASFEALDISDVPGSVRSIRRLLAQPPTVEEKELVAAARQAILNRYNPFARFAAWANEFYRDGPREPWVIRSEKAFRFLRGPFYRWQNRNWKPGS